MARRKINHFESCSKKNHQQQHRLYWLTQIKLISNKNEDKNNELDKFDVILNNVCDQLQVQMMRQVATDQKQEKTLLTCPHGAF